MPQPADVGRARRPPAPEPPSDRYKCGRAGSAITSATNLARHRAPRFSIVAAARNSNLAVAEGGTILIRLNPGKLWAIIPEEVNFG